MSVLKVSTFIITSITACPTGLTAILVIISVSVFITTIILYLSCEQIKRKIHCIQIINTKITIDYMTMMVIFLAFSTLLVSMFTSSVVDRGFKP